MKSYGSSFPAWPSGGREKFPGKANPGSAPDIDRSEAGLESGEATAKWRSPRFRATSLP
jgi:hypothetical protein